MTSKPGPILGIDLGTTNSCVAVMDGGEARVLANREGSRTTPSVVAFVGDDILVGEAARQRASKDPAATVFAAKRLIGRKFAEVEAVRRGLPTPSSPRPTATPGPKSTAAAAHPARSPRRCSRT